MNRRSIDPNTSVTAAAASAHRATTGRAFTIVERMIERCLVRGPSVELHGRVGKNCALFRTYGGAACTGQQNAHPERPEWRFPGPIRIEVLADGHRMFLSLQHRRAQK